LFRDTAPFRTAAPTDTVNTFVPPVLNVSSQTNTAKGTTLVLTFYGIPLAPGRSRVITAFFTDAKVPGWVSRAAAAAEWWFHLGQNQVLDSDAMLLHVQVSWAVRCPLLISHLSGAGPECGARSAQLAGHLSGNQC
jgi:hypothetical protein